jgi:outer membrane protein OmpA-like peptidoglycan-associated protein
MSTRLDDSYTQWSAPVPVAGLNTTGRELFYREAGYGALYTGTTNSDGYGDIKWLNPEEVHQDTAQVTPVVFTPRIPETPGTLALTGRISNASTGRPIAGSVRITGDTSLVINASESGYSTQLSASGTYQLEVTAQGYVNVFEKLELSTQEVKTLTKDFALQPVAVGTTVTLKNILFIQGQPELLAESYAELNVVVDFLNANPHLEIELAGHTDNRGTYRSLMTLSQKRVNRVKQYLVSKGIDARRITGKGYGGTKPLASNDTEESRQLNRRVEFTIKKV